MKIKSIALNTFKEAARNKIFYLLLFFGIGFALASKLFSLLTIGDPNKVIKDIGLSAINFFTVLIAIFTGINLLYKEIDKRTIYNILSKPISRSKFIIGKFLGLTLTLLAALSAMAVIFFFFVYINTGTWEWRIILSFYLLFLELLIVIAISLLFSSFTTPILASIFTISIYLIGRVLWTFNDPSFRLLFFTQPVTTVLLKFIYYVMPNFDKFNMNNAIIQSTSLPPQAIIIPTLYAVGYVAALLLLTMAIFNKREFQ
jgi:ABC-type transport system involved in multi-copper enzyme maturation permease subunit